MGGDLLNWLNCNNRSVNLFKPFLLIISMRIAIDLDEVLADYINPFLEFYNSSYQTNFIKEQIVEYDWWKIFNCDREEMIQRAYRFYQTHNFRNLAPVQGSQEAISSLSKQHELFIVTSRPFDIAQETIAWVKKYFPDGFSGLYLTNNWSNNSSLANKKSDICRDLNLEIIIEDAPDTCYECAESGINVLVYDCPWNKEIQHQKIQRIKSWADALKMINDLSQNP